MLQENIVEMIEQVIEIATQLQSHNSQFFQVFHFPGFFLRVLKGFIKKRNVSLCEHSTSELFIETIVEKMLSKWGIAQGVTVLSVLCSKADKYIVEQFLEVCVEVAMVTE